MKSAREAAIVEVVLRPHRRQMRDLERPARHDRLPERQYRRRRRRRRRHDQQEEKESGSRPSSSSSASIDAAAAAGTADRDASASSIGRNSCSREDVEADGADETRRKQRRRRRPTRAAASVAAKIRSASSTTTRSLLPTGQDPGHSLVVPTLRTFDACLFLLARSLNECFFWMTGWFFSCWLAGCHLDIFLCSSSLSLEESSPLLIQE